MCIQDEASRREDAEVAAAIAAVAEVEARDAREAALRKQEAEAAAAVEKQEAEDAAAAAASAAAAAERERAKCAFDAVLLSLQYCYRTFLYMARLWLCSCWLLTVADWLSHEGPSS